MLRWPEVPSKAYFGAQDTASWTEATSSPTNCPVLPGSYLPATGTAVPPLEGRLSQPTVCTPTAERAVLGRLWRGQRTGAVPKDQHGKQKGVCAPLCPKRIRGWQGGQTHSDSFREATAENVGLYLLIGHAARGLPIPDPERRGRWGFQWVS